MQTQENAPQSDTLATAVTSPYPEVDPTDQSVPKSGVPDPIQPPRPPHRRLRGWQIAMLLLLVALLIAGGVLSAFLLRGRPASVLMPPLTSLPGGPEPHVEPPLSAEQIDEIHRLRERLKRKQLAKAYVANMSLDEIIGQLIMPQYEGAYYSPDLDYMLNQQHVGGIIMYAPPSGSQLRTSEQVKQDIARMQSQAHVPLFVGIEEEGWNVSRLKEIYPGKRPSAADIRDSGSTQFAAEQGQKVAQDMRALGINVNFAPVVDVAEKDMYIDYDYRGFGSTPEEVIKYTDPYLAAMQKAGVVGTLKHFPGIGSIPYVDDPHSVLPTITHSKDEIYRIDLAPYRHFLKQKGSPQYPGFIMTTYVMVPSIDSQYPAQYSYKLITEVLRNELDYDGVVITDSLIMGGSQIDGKTIDVGQGAVLALQAGNDVLLGPVGSVQVELVVKDVKAALQDGTLTQERLKESATRIITLKMERGLMPAETP